MWNPCFEDKESNQNNKLSNTDWKCYICIQVSESILILGVVRPADITLSMLDNINKNPFVESKKSKLAYFEYIIQKLSSFLFNNVWTKERVRRFFKIELM